MKWNKKAVCDLIPLIESHKELWDQSTEIYWDLNAKIEAFDRIAEILGTNSLEVEKKTDQLKAHFLRMWYKYKKTILTNPNAKDLCKPTWYAFRPLSFLAKENETQDGREDSTLESSCQPREKTPGQQSQRDSVIMTSSAGNANSTGGPSLNAVQPRQSYRPRTQGLKYDDYNYNPYGGYRWKHKDEFDSFGEYVAGELRKFTQDKQILAITKNKINRILYESDLLLIEKSSKNYHARLPYQGFNNAYGVAKPN